MMNYAVILANQKWRSILIEYYLLLGNLSYPSLNIFIEPHYQGVLLIVPWSGRERTGGE